MAKPLVFDELWAAIEPLLPPQPSRPKGGRPRIPDRAALKTGTPWEMLPPEMGCGSGMTCWHRLRDWQEAGVWDRLHQVLLDRLGQADRIDWSRASIDAFTVAAPRGGEKTIRLLRTMEDSNGHQRQAVACEGVDDGQVPSRDGRPRHEARSQSRSRRGRGGI